MNRMLISGVVLLLTTTGCAELRELTDRNANPYEKSPFYAKYLNTGSVLDAEMLRLLDALRANPESAELHNDLGALLVEKGFPKDAEREFERAINADKRYVPAWYNLGLIRAANDDAFGARRAFMRTIDLKPGHSAALFQLGLIEEKRQHTDRAVALYAKAFSINPALLEVDVNPRILDTDLVGLALLAMYDREHTRESMQFQDAPSFYAPVPPSAAAIPPVTPPAPSPQAKPENIVAPAAPVTDPGTQTQPNRRRRPRTPEADQQQQQPPGR